MRQALFLLLVCGLAKYAHASECAALISGKYTGVEITTAESVPHGAFTPKDESGAPAALFRELPAFCRVVGVTRPTTDSQIGFELWLPDKWNGRYLQTGNGGFAGVINYGGMIFPLANGFAVASTDDGHTGPGAAWALGHPEKVIDYGYRAVHLTSVISKQVVAGYYRRTASHTYFSGCSDGGRESLMEAQRFPEDFDGYLVGAPGNDFTGVMTHLLNLAQIAASMKEPLTSTQLEALHKAALERCDAADGTRDGVIENPLSCPFDPAALQCTGAPDGQCLSETQAKAVGKIYDDTRGGRNRVSLTPGFRVALGAEATQWPYWVGPVPKDSGLSETLSQMFSENFWRFMVYGEPKLNFRTLDLAQAAADARARVGALLNSVDPDLRAARALGKKIIQYHGWADAVNPAQYSIGYYEAVEKYLGTDNRDFYRLFMAPGVEHCGGGLGPNAFGMSYDPRPFGAGFDATRAFDADHHILAALVQWVEKGVAPERIVATKYQDDDAAKSVVRTRPLCVWPREARWTHHGSTDDAGNFVCSERTRDPFVDADGTVHLPEFSVPLSVYLSEPARRSVIKALADSQSPQPYGVDVNTSSVAEIREAVNRTLRPMLERTKGNYPVRIESKSFAGVPTLVVVPAHGFSSRNRSRVMVNLHGGGFEVGGGGVHGLLESIPISAVAQIKVVTVDYRMGPENVFPAASEDVAAVYRSLLKDYPAKNIGIYGCSAGGVLAAQSAAWIQHEKLPRAGAIGIFSASAFADFTGSPQAPGSWGGDSRYLAAPLQGESPLPALDASHTTVSRVPYLAHVDLTDRLVSPGYASDVLAQFPPTLLITGTRAYDMSAAVQTERNLRKAGVEADLELWDGLGHCFFLDSDLPESKEMFEVVAKFFDRHLGL